MRDILEHFPTEIVELCDENNKKIKDLKGLFGKTGFTVTDISTPIIEGQKIIRKLPNGAEENYTIIASKFNNGHGDICSFYKLILQKSNCNLSTNANNNVYINNSITIGNNNKFDESTIGNDNK